MNDTENAAEAAGDKQYVVKSVFVGEQDISTALLKLAERRALDDMGLK